MELKILAISDKGNLLNERIGFKVLKKCQLKFFIVFKTKKANGGFINRSNDTYWFPSMDVNENDKVVLYTKKGTPSIIDNNDGTKTYFYYWDKENGLFKNEDEIIVLINANTWLINE